MVIVEFSGRNTQINRTMPNISSSTMAGINVKQCRTDTYSVYTRAGCHFAQSSYFVQQKHVCILIVLCVSACKDALLARRRLQMQMIEDIEIYKLSGSWLETSINMNTAQHISYL